MTNQEFTRRSNIINKAIESLQRHVTVPVYVESIKVDSLRDSVLNVNFIYIDKYNKYNPDIKMSICWGFEEYWFDTKKWIDMKHRKVWGNNWQWQETEDHIPSTYNIPEDDKAALRIAYQYYRALKRHGKEFVK